MAWSPRPQIFSTSTKDRPMSMSPRLFKTKLAAGTAVAGAAGVLAANALDGHDPEEPAKATKSPKSRRKARKPSGTSWVDDYTK